MSVARRLSLPFPQGSISLGNGMPQGTVVINYVVSCSQACCQSKKRKDEFKWFYTYQHGPIDGLYPDKCTAVDMHISLLMNAKLHLLSLLYLTHLFLISFLQRFSSPWLISKEIVWEFSAKAVSMVTARSLSKNSTWCNQQNFSSWSNLTTRICTTVRSLLCHSHSI